MNGRTIKPPPGGAAAPPGATPLGRPRPGAACDRPSASARSRGFFRRGAIAVAIAVAVAMLLGAAGGCSPYVLRGKVVTGPRSTAEAVEAGSAQLSGPAIEQAAVQLMLDPRSGGRRMLGTVFTDEAGRFEMPVEALGAGTLEYELLVIARHPGRTPAQAVIDLPGRGKRVLVRLAEGRDRPVSAEGWNSAPRDLGGFNQGGWPRPRRSEPAAGP